MSFLNKLFGKGETETMEREPETTATCLHTTLTPSWDSVADMGNEDKVTGWHCEGCDQRFSPEEGRALRRSEADRVQHELNV